jgi:drug/metabolite transporter (DMT)-like permease
MSATALALVLTGAMLHALWNIAAKRATGGVLFVCLQGWVSVVTLAPLAAWALFGSGKALPSFYTLLSLPLLAAAALSAAIHLVYAVILQHGYRVSDFSVVYPVARGSGPLLTVLASVLWLGELPSVAGWLGIMGILLGVFLTAGGTGLLMGKGADSRRAQGVAWGAATGVCIAAYTLADGWAIKVLGLTPIVFYITSSVCRMVMMVPFVWGRGTELRACWRDNRRPIFIVGMVSPIAYLLVLTAVQTSPISYVAPVREVSMLIGTFVGAKLLHEAFKAEQMAGAALMLAGVAALALA